MAENYSWRFVSIRGHSCFTVPTLQAPVRVGTCLSTNGHESNPSIDEAHSHEREEAQRMERLARFRAFSCVSAFKRVPSVQCARRIAWEHSWSQKRAKKHESKLGISRSYSHVPTPPRPIVHAASGPTVGLRRRSRTFTIREILQPSLCFVGRRGCATSSRMRLLEAKTLGRVWRLVLEWRRLTHGSHSVLKDNAEPR